MKNLKYLFFALLATFALAACSDDETLQPEKDVENCYDVYFPRARQCRRIDVGSDSSHLAGIHRYA